MDTLISGFTIVRNAVKLKYPFLESVRSIIPLCWEFLISYGDSTDDTWKLCEILKSEFSDKIRIFPTVWDEAAQSDGFQLKYQTDLALGHCNGSWCFYLQADEVIHEDDYSKILNAIKVADLYSEIDGILFDYLHFYGTYDYTVTGRNWYRKEVRCFKNNRNICAFRDAQGFRKNGRRLSVIESHAKIFHYGYVRTNESLKIKEMEMNKWWGKDGAEVEVSLYRPVGMKRFNLSHPLVMQERIKNFKSHEITRFQRKFNFKELKNALTLLWETFFPWRIGEFKNYKLLRYLNRLSS